jgi:hypothetical protein
VTLDDGRIREQAVDRHDGGDPREQRQQDVVGYAAGNGHHPVPAEFLIDPPEDVLPAAGGNLGRRVGVPAAPAFSCGSRGGVLLRAEAAFLLPPRSAAVSARALRGSLA